MPYEISNPENFYEQIFGENFFWCFSCPKRCGHSTCSFLATFLIHPSWWIDLEKTDYPVEWTINDVLKVYISKCWYRVTQKSLCTLFFLHSLKSNFVKFNFRCPNCLDERWFTWPDPNAGMCGVAAPAIDGKYLAVCDPDDAQYVRISNIKLLHKLGIKCTKLEALLR